jgi:hypothetical protein
MPILQNTAISFPRHEYLVAFSVASAGLAKTVRRNVVVLAETPAGARRICKQRYPGSLHVEVWPRVPALA